MEVSTTSFETHIIDLNTATTLKKDGKPARYLGCSAHVILVTIVLLKSALLAAWLIREYDSFEFGCSSLYSSVLEEQGDPVRLIERAVLPEITEISPRHTRSVRKDLLDPRVRKRPLLGGSRRLLSTMVTHTNTQVLHGENETSVKMKTIRNRVEKVEHGQGGYRGPATIQGPPTIYISPILNTKTNQPSDRSSLKEKKRKKKKKGKGKKKKKTTTTTTTTTTERPKKESKNRKKSKGHRKKKKEGRGRKKGSTEHTKSPRHLFSPTGATTPRPHGSSFLHGAIDPSDDAFSNKGQIRGYPMQKARKKPKSDLKLSKETRLMWELNEVNYTTHAMAPKTTEMTETGPKKEKPAPTSFSPAFVKPERPSHPQLSTSTMKPSPKKDFYSTHKVTTWSKKGTGGAGEKKATTQKGPPTTTQPVAIYYETIKQREPGTDVSWPKERVKDKKQKSKDRKRKEELQIETTEKPKVIKHGFDRGLDAAIDDGSLKYPIRTTTQKNEPPEGPYRFQNELTSFTSSSVCVARLLFDLWCICQLLSTIPFLIGVCAARRSLFVPHLVLDILFLVIGSIFSITTAVFSVMLYLLVGEMRRSTLLYWLLFALLLDVVLVLYSAAVVISLRSCERVVQARKTRQKISTSLGEAV